MAKITSTGGAAASGTSAVRARGAARSAARGFTPAAARAPLERLPHAETPRAAHARACSSKGFAKDEGGAVFHTYSTFGRGIEIANPTYQLLDLLPKGRDEGGRKMAWVRYHDEYPATA